MPYYGCLDSTGSFSTSGPSYRVRKPFNKKPVDNKHRKFQKNVISTLYDERAPSKLELTPRYPGFWVYPMPSTIRISPVPWQLRPIHRLTPLQPAYAVRLELPICVQLSLRLWHNGPSRWLVQDRSNKWSRKSSPGQGPLLQRGGNLATVHDPPRLLSSPPPFPGSISQYQ